eukprot:6195168-Pleurochrysis_carterae.AAC.2
MHQHILFYVTGFVWNATALVEQNKPTFVFECCLLTLRVVIQSFKLLQTFNGSESNIMGCTMPSNFFGFESYNSMMRELLGCVLSAVHKCNN